MRRLTAIALLATAACGDNEGPPTPVDMTYQVEVTEIEDDCDAILPAEGARPYVDARLWPDGTAELVSWSASIPGPGSFPNIRVEGNHVDYEASRYATATMKDYDFRIRGTLTMEALDLEIAHDWYTYDNGVRNCSRRVRIQGAARGYHDRESLDGRYPLEVAYMGEYCDGDPQPNVPLGIVTMMLNADPREAEMYFNLGGALYMGGPLPGADDLLWWDGTFYLLTTEGIADVPGTLRGQFRPDGVLLDLEFTTTYQAPDCRERYRLAGHKRLASRYSVSNEYRAVLRTYDNCDGTGEAFYTTVDVMEVGDGAVIVNDDFGVWGIDRTGETLFETDGSEEEGVLATFDGIAAPPYLSYKLEFKLKDGDGWCSIGHQVDAVARFFPELEWDPAFLPDEEGDEASMSSALRISPVPAIPILSFGPPVEIGPMIR